MRTLPRTWRLAGFAAIAAGASLLYACSNEPSQPTAPLIPPPSYNIVGYGGSAGTTFLDNGAQWTSGFDVGTSVGTGVIRPFLDMQASPSEEGFNTDNNTFLYDQHRTTDTNALPINYVPVFNADLGDGPIPVREFVLDAHESDNYFDIDEFAMYLCFSDAARTYQSYPTDVQGNCDPVYTIAGGGGAGGDTINATDQFSSGSGNVFDYRVLIPDSLFQKVAADAGKSVCPYDPSATAEAACHTYIILWSKMSNTGSTFEEFSTILRPAVKIVKTPDAGTADAGNDISFNMVVSSAGATASSVTLADTLPMGPAGHEVDWYQATTSAGTCAITGTSPAQQYLSCSLGDIATNSPVTVTVTAHTQQTSCAVYDNTAHVTSTDAGSDSDPGQITLQNCTGTVIVKKITNGGYGTAFDYTTTGGLTPASFSLTTTAAGAVGADSLVYANVLAGPYSVTESAPPAGWQFTSLSCTTGGAASGQVADITLVPGATVTCTYTNTKQGGIVIEKITNGGYGTPFDYTTSGSGLSSFSLTTTAEGAAGKDTKTFSNLAPGSYSVTEGTLPTGWQFTSLVCTSGGVAASKTANITLVAGATVTCTYTNTKQGKIVIKKVTNGGYGTAFDYTTTGGLTPASFSLTTTAAGAAGADSLVYSNLAPGSYSVAEAAAPTGWQFTSLSCTTGGVASGQTANITLAAGATVTCTYTNTKQGTIRIVKETTGGAATFPYSTTGGLSPATFNLTTTAAGPDGRDSTTYSNLAPGSYSVTEGTLPTGWVFSSLSCTAGGTAADKTANITLAAGATVRCIYTNTKQPKLGLVKRVVNDNGGTATVTDFGITTTAGSPLSFDGGVADGTATLKYTSDILTVDPGTYSLHEGTVTGYTDGTWSCTKGLLSGDAQTGSVQLAAGDSVTCTITNNDQPPMLKVVKVVKGAPSTFGFSATGDGLPGTFSLTPPVADAADTVVYTNLTAGAFSVAEDPNSGYTLTDLGCSDQAIGQYDPASTRMVIDTLSLGESVTCTFINQQNSGTTRTQGFWATHMSLTEAVWFGGSAGGHDFSGLSAADQTLCARQLTTIGEVLGGFWSNIARTTGHDKRSSLDQARMQLLQQLLAAILNHAAFGSSPSGGVSIADAKAAYCGTDVDAIRTAASAMAAFNTSGDNGTFTPGVSANGKQAKDAADLAFWDILP